MEGVVLNRKSVTITNFFLTRATSNYVSFHVKNKLQSIPESIIARLLNVVVLDVRSNQLTSLPNSIGCLSKLKVLNVSGNLLRDLPATIEECR